MKNSKNPLARSKDLVVQESADEVLVYNLNTHKASCLNQTAALVWKHCDGKQNIEGIAKLVEKEIKSPIPVELVWLAIDQLEKEELLEAAPEEPIVVKGLGRREVIRRIALATIVAVPLVSTLTFPKGSLAVACTASTVGCVGGTAGCPCPAGTTCVDQGGGAFNCV